MSWRCHDLSNSRRTDSSGGPDIRAIRYNRSALVYQNVRRLAFAPDSSVLDTGSRAQCATGELPMRRIIDTLFAIVLVGVLAGVAMHYKHERRFEQDVMVTRSEVRRFQAQIMVQSALEKVPLSKRGYPLSIETQWFGGKLPKNLLLGAGYPWVEIASADQRNRTHPARRMATDRTLAQFWYNPNSGVVRARVPDSVSDATALRLYNEINDSSVSRVY